MFRKSSYWKSSAAIAKIRPGDTIALKSIDLHFPIEQIYRGLNLTPAADSQE
ncbi:MULTISPECIES: hypothetical protein [unclassified Limnothrix]|uniref:hypothetical protein n=1 Tax=unclassified Limnothrix TaxID=2632864 RepID=UPI0018F03141|nr:MULTISPECIES: hypothetical protein [unclassified Limnothrix]